MKTIKSFTTIDQCVDWLISHGELWTYSKEQQLMEAMVFRTKTAIVFYDPYEILA
jgi:hypothetical protein